jgi:hypothetical protein
MDRLPFYIFIIFIIVMSIMIGLGISSITLAQFNDIITALEAVK